MKTVTTKKILILPFLVPSKKEIDIGCALREFLFRELAKIKQLEVHSPLISLSSRRKRPVAAFLAGKDYPPLLDFIQMAWPPAEFFVEGGVTSLNPWQLSLSLQTILPPTDYDLPHDQDQLGEFPAARNLSFLDVVEEPFGAEGGLEAVSPADERPVVHIVQHQVIEGTLLSICRDIQLFVQTVAKYFQTTPESMTELPDTENEAALRAYFQGIQQEQELKNGFWDKDIREYFSPYLTAVEADPNFKVAKDALYSMLSLVLFHKKFQNDDQRKKIDSVFRQITSRVNDPIYLLFIQSLKAYKEGHLAEAEICFQKIIDMQPEVAKHRYNLGMFYEAHHHTTKAIRVYQKAILDGFHDPLIMANLGAIYAQKGVLARATELLLEAETFLPDSEVILANLFHVFYEQKEWVKMWDYFQQGIQLPSPIWSTYQNVFMKDGPVIGIERGIDLLTEYCRLYQTSFNGHFTLGILAKLNGDLENAEYYLQQARGLTNSIDDYTRVTWQLLQLNFEDFDTLFQKACKLISMHTPYEGLEFLERILEQEPRFWPAMIPISYGYKQIGQFERAYEALTKCYEIQPNNPDIASELGICAIHLGKYKEGERYLLQAVNASPTHKGYLKNLATYYSAVPKKRRALEIIDKLLELYPDDEELQAFRQEVEFARGNTWERFHGWWSVGMTRLFDKLFSHLKE